MDPDGTTRISYNSRADAVFPYAGPARQLDVSIPGAAGSVPGTTIASALHAPAELVVTSPATGSERSFVGGSVIPIRWEAGGSVADGSTQMISLTIIPLAPGSTEILFSFLSDDGEYDLDTTQLGGMTGPVRIVISRSIERYEGLPIGPSMMIRGTSLVNLDATIR